MKFNYTKNDGKEDKSMFNFQKILPYTNINELKNYQFYD